MEFALERELVHLRYELRRLMVDGRRDDVPPLLDRLRKLAADIDSEPERPGLRREIDRWASSFDL
jgi:hypothetical protein